MDTKISSSFPEYSPGHQSPVQTLRLSCCKFLDLFRIVFSTKSMLSFNRDYEIKSSSGILFPGLEGCPVDGYD